MAFNKTANFSVSSMSALNTPTGWEIFDLPKQIKTASVTSQAKTEDLGGFNIKEAVNKHPDHLFVKIFAIKKDEVNDNGDAFSESELIKSAETFIGVPLFTNHQNDDIEKARGECVHSWYDKEAGGIYIVGKVDKIAYPKLARGIEENYILGTSMGCSVEYSCCSVCHNKAHTSDEYCDHVKNRKNRKYSGDMTCKYHDSKVSTDEKCPICSSTKKEAKTIHHDDQKIYEHNFGLKFIENSFVVNPACHECGVKCILNIPEIQKKMASLNETVDSLIKQSSESSNLEKLQKVGGVKELDSLKNSMNKMEEVVQSMLKQKEQVSMEYVSDLVKAMADVQGIFDELNEMGYGKLPSPIIAEGATPTMPIQGSVSPQPTMQPQPINNNIGEGGKSTAGDLGGLGSITKPKTSSKNKEDFSGINRKLINKVSSLRELTSNIYNRRASMADSIFEISANAQDPTARKIIITKNDDDIFVSEANGEKVLKVAHISQFTTELQELIKNNPEQAGQMILNNNSKEIGANMATPNVKTAGIKDHDTITEKQMEEAKSRKDTTPTMITESKEQLGGTESNNVTTSESGQVRKDNTPDVITEKQFDTVKGASLLRLDNTPDVITEKQWTDMSNLVSAKLSSDWNTVITEKQIAELLKSHQFVGAPDVITEKQLNDIKMTDGLKRWASKSYAANIMKVATEIIADVIATFKKSPADISNAASIITDNADIKAKASYASVVNALPYKKAERELLASNITYFTKIASEQSQISTMDALIQSTASNAQTGQYAEDLFDAVGHALRNKVAMAKVEELVKNKLANRTDTQAVSKFDALESAIKGMNKSDDGKYRVLARVEDVGVSISNKKAFAAGVRKLAIAQIVEEIGDSDVPMAIINVKVDGSGNLLIDVQDKSNGGDEADMSVDQIGEAIEGVVDDVDAETSFEDEEATETEEHEETETPEFEEAEHEQGTENPFVEEEDDKKECSCGKSASTKVSKLATAREEIIKKAQMMGGEMGGQGGASQAPGAGASLPMAPGAGAGQAPMESLTNPAQPQGEEDVEGESSEPLPPGSICPVCGSEDVDVVSGKGKCNSCSSEMNFKVEINVTKWKDLTPEGDENPGDEGAFGEGEGFELPADGETPPATDAGAPAGGMPGVAASMRLKPEALKKLAESKITIGSVSPATGSTNTLDLGGGNYVCLDTGTKYKLSYMTDALGKNVFAQWEWKPVYMGEYPKCTSCSRARSKFVKALSSVKMTEAQFDALDMSKKAETILTMKKAGALKQIKTASKNSSVISDLKVAFGGYGDKFPIESCREKLARRFGQNALAMSGPCEGENLADCVCNQLKKADLYTDKIAIKVAEVWRDDCTGDEQCITDQIRNGYDIRAAASVCETLKVAMAEKIGVTDPEYLVAEELGQDFGAEPDPTTEGPDGPNGGGMPTEEPVAEDIDPFDNPEAEGTVTIELPKDVAQQIADKVNEAVGGAGEDVGSTDIAAEPMEGELTSGEPKTDGITETVTPDDINGSPVEEAPMVPEETKPCENIPGNEEINKGLNTGKVEISVNGQKGDSSLDNKEYGMKEASSMKSTVAGIGKIQMDLTAVAAIVNKKADKEVSLQNAQDSKDIGKYTGGENAGSIGNEEPVKAVKPSVPRDKALIGNEDANLNPQDKPLPQIPSGKAEIGGEAAAGYTGGDNRATGGNVGAGKTETASSDADLMHMKGFGSNKDSLTRMAERIVAAGDKKVEAPKPVSEDKDIKPISDGKTIGNEEKFDAKEIKPTDIKTDGGHIGHEKETIGDKPDAPKDMPSIPADNALMGGEGKDIAPEKQTNTKGTVMAKTEGHAESEAIRVAGRMLEAKKITASELSSKISELKAYQPAQIRDFEKSIFAGQKGLDSVSDGISQPVIINENSNQRSSTSDLTAKLASMFTLGKQNLLADDDEVTQVRKMYGKN